jgi:TRAP-type C4-dicarboxylate transport system permease small subunit
MAILMLMTFLGAGDVIGRYLFNNPIVGAGEISRVMMGAVIFLCWAYVLSVRGHVAVDIAFRRFPPRMQAITGFIVLLLTLVPFSMIAWRGAIQTIVDWQGGRILHDILIPEAPFRALVVFGAFLLCLECIIQMVHLIPGMRGEEED